MRIKFLLFLALSTFLAHAADTMTISVVSEDGAFVNRNFVNGTEIFKNRSYVLQNIPAEFSGFDFLASDGKVADQGIMIPSASGYVYVIGPASGVTGWTLVANSQFNYNDVAQTAMAIYRKAVSANEAVYIPNNTSFPGVSPIASTIIFEKLDLFLCIGQSNMAGRDAMNSSLGDFIPVDNAFLYTTSNFINAVNPFNGYSDIDTVGFSGEGVSPAFSFSKKVAATGRRIGLVVNARGGSSISSWDDKTDDLYLRTMLRALEAKKWGTFKGILWHQGEANANATALPSYPSQLTNLVAHLREDLGDPNLFFVAGQIGQFKASHADFNAMITTISTFISNSACALSDGLTDKGDGLHFNRASQLILGERYADIVLDRVYNQGTSQISAIIEGSGFQKRTFANGVELFTNRTHTIQNAPAAFSGFEFAASDGGSVQGGTIIPSADGFAYIIAPTTGEVSGWSLVPNTTFNTSDAGQTSHSIYKKEAVANVPITIPNLTSFSGATPLAKIVTVNTGASLIPIAVLGSGYTKRSFANGTQIFTNRTYTIQNAPATFSNFEFLASDGGAIQSGSITPSGDGFAYIIAPTSGGVSGWDLVPNSTFNYSDTGQTSLSIYQKAAVANTAITIPNVTSFAGASPLAKIISLNGSTAKSTESKMLTSEISDPIDGQSFIVYPNPASGEFNIQLPVGEKADISIFDMGGRLLYDKKGVDQILNIKTGSIFKSGFYIINAVTEDKKVFTKKIGIK